MNAARQARAELAELREDLDALGALAGRVATFTRDGHAVDHQTCVELVAFVTSARDSLGNAEACLVESADGEKSEAAHG